MSETRRLAAFVADTRFDDLPPELVERAKVYCWTTWRPASSDRSSPGRVMVAELARELGGCGERRS